MEKASMIGINMSKNLFELHGRNDGAKWCCGTLTDEGCIGARALRELLWRSVLRSSPDADRVYLRFVWICNCGQAPCRGRLRRWAYSSDAVGLLLGTTDRAVRLVDRFAACFRDGRRANLVEHEVRTLVGQRVSGLALGYEDLVDQDWLRHDPVMAVLVGKLSARRETCMHTP